MTGREPLAQIVGVGESAYSRGTDQSEWELAVDAVSRALG